MFHPARRPPDKDPKPTHEAILFKTCDPNTPNCNANTRHTKMSETRVSTQLIGTRRNNGMNNMTKTCGNSTGVQRCRDNGTKHNNVQEQPCRRTAPVLSEEHKHRRLINPCDYNNLSTLWLCGLPQTGEPPRHGDPSRTKLLPHHSAINQLDNTILIALGRQSA